VVCGDGYGAGIFVSFWSTIFWPRSSLALLSRFASFAGSVVSSRAPQPTVQSFHSKCKLIYHSRCPLPTSVPDCPPDAVYCIDFSKIKFCVSEKLQVTISSHFPAAGVRHSTPSSCCSRPSSRSRRAWSIQLCRPTAVRRTQPHTASHSAHSLTQPHTLPPSGNLLRT
jgi:hypothetical protein